MKPRLLKVYRYWCLEFWELQPGDHLGMSPLWRVFYFESWQAAVKYMNNPDAIWRARQSRFVLAEKAAA